jgi:hypothetical protein
MDIQIGKLYWAKDWHFTSDPPELIVVTGILEEEQLFSLYWVNRGFSGVAFFPSFRQLYILSPA